MTALSRYHWPGNVRELQNVMSALAVAAPAQGRCGRRCCRRSSPVRAAAGATTLADARAQFERRFIEIALAGRQGSGLGRRELGCRGRGS